MPETLQAVETDLRQKFSQTFQNSAHFPTYARIGSFLSDPSQYYQSLLELEMKLEDERGERVDAIKHAIWKTRKEKFQSKALLTLLQGIRDERFAKTNKIAQEIKPYVPYAKQLYSKLLSSVLFRWESMNGFELDPSGKVDILMGNPGKLFNDQLKDGRPFKDVGAGKQHGEFSHRVQMFMIGVGLKLPNTGDIYRNVAKYITVQPQNSLSGQPGPKRYLWEYLFDRDGMPSNAQSVAFAAVDKFDFRAPSNLNRALMKEGPKGLAILGWCLRDRFEKRSFEGMSLSYIEKKAPKDEQAKLAGKAGRAMQGMGVFDPVKHVSVMNRVTQGLFIRRGEEVVEIDWQAQA